MTSMLKSKKDKKPIQLNKKTAAYLRRVLKDANAGRNMSPAFTNIEDADAWLDSPDKD